LDAIPFRIQGRLSTLFSFLLLSLLCTLKFNLFLEARDGISQSEQFCKKELSSQIFKDTLVMPVGKFIFNFFHHNGMPASLVNGLSHNSNISVFMTDQCSYTHKLVPSLAQATLI